MKKHLLLAAFLFAATPVALLVPGCGGSSDNLGTTQNYSSALDLSSSQTAQVALSVRGNNVQGTISVANLPVSQDRSTRQVTFSIPVGTYSYSGTLTPPNTFTVNGTFPAPVGAFTLSGQVPANGGNGNYTLTVNGQTSTGTFSTTTTTPTAITTSTPQPTVTTQPTTTTQPTITSTPRPTATVRPTATARPTATPRPTATARPTTQPTFEPIPTPTAPIFN